MVKNTEFIVVIRTKLPIQTEVSSKIISDFQNGKFWLLLCLFCFPLARPSVRYLGWIHFWNLNDEDLLFSIFIASTLEFLRSRFYFLNLDITVKSKKANNLSQYSPDYKSSTPQPFKFCLSRCLLSSSALLLVSFEGVSGGVSGADILSSYRAWKTRDLYSHSFLATRASEMWKSIRQIQVTTKLAFYLIFKTYSCHEATCTNRPFNRRKRAVKMQNNGNWWIGGVIKLPDLL